MQALLTNEQIKYLIDNKLIKNNKTHMEFNKLPKSKIFRLHHCELINDTYYFYVYDIDSRDKIYKLPINCLETIDDMECDRFLQAFIENEEDMNILEIDEKTNVESKIIGKKKAKLNGVALEDGMKIILHNDKNIKLNNKTLTVRGVGEEIKLVAPRGRPKKITE